MLSSSKASNWVDRGEPADARVAQVVAHFLDVPDAAKAEAPWLADAARELVGMVIAGATEVEVAGYLRRLATERGRAVMDAPPARVFAVGIWHTVKAAEVRDRAERVIRALAAGRDAEVPPLAEWLAERMLTPEELRQHRAQQQNADGDDA